MSDIIPIEDLRKAFVEKTTKKDLTAFAQKQQELISELNKQLDTIKQKNKHLESLLTDLSKGNIVKEVSGEEMICIEQISILRSKSSQRELSLEEIKKLDLLVKNVKLIRNEATEVIDIPNMNNFREEDLVRIAQSTEI